MRHRKNKPGRRKCWYCGVTLTNETRTVDHVIPKSQGGKNTKENLTSCCEPCNQQKGAKSLDEFRQERGYVAFWGEMNERRTR